MLVYLGEADYFLADQLRTDLVRESRAKDGYPMSILLQPGYDHSYFFIASFIGEHLDFHASHL